MARDGRLYGRGTADMKSFLAIALALVPEMLAAELRVPIHLAISYDEEVWVHRRARADRRRDRQPALAAPWSSWASRPI